MSDDVEQFVLKYNVDMKEAESRLQLLNDKIDKTGKATDKGREAFKQFGTDAADEIGKVIPGIDKISGAVRIMSAEFVAASAALAVLAIGVKSVIDLRAQFGEQRLAGMDSGLSTLRLEDYQRKFAKNSNGNVSRELALEEIKGLSERFRSAYTDPTRVGTEAKQMRMLGVDIAPIGSRPRAFNDMFTQLANNFSKMKPEQVQGIAKAIGMNQDFALTMQRLGGSVGRVTELTQEDIRNRQSAEESLRAFNTEMAVFSTKANELEISLGEHLIPAFTKLIELVNKIVKLVPMDEINGSIDRKTDIATGKTNDAKSVLGEVIRSTIFGSAMDLGEKARGWGKKVGLFSSKEDDTNLSKIGSVIANQVSGANKKNDPQDLVAKGKTLEQSVDKIVDSADRNNNMAAQSASDMQLAVNMFNGAVSTFANAIDEKQAWAAWAGEVGAASGMSAPKGTIGNQSPQASSGGPSGAGSAVYRATASSSSQYDNDIAEASRKTGIPIDVLKNVIRVESQGNQNARSGKGAIGLMQVMPENGRRMGLDLTDPKQNIEAGSKVLAGFLKIAGGDMRKALTMYHGGTDESNWGPLTRAYASKVLGEVGGSGYTGQAGGGQRRDDLRLQAVRENLAARLGVPVKQLTFGGVNRGDADWALKQKEGEVSNQIFQIRTDLMQANVPQQTRSKWMNELRLQESGLQQLQTYGPQIVQQQQEGDRAITIGERAVVININGVQNPQENANVMQHQLQDQLGHIVNQAATGQKL